MAGAQIVAEPGDDETDAFNCRHRRLQMIERHHHVGGVGQRVEIGRDLCPGAAMADALRRISEFARSRNHGDGANQPFGGVGIGERPKHLEGQLRQAVAVIGERQFLEHNVSRATIGRRIGRAHPGGNEGVCGLVLVAGIPAPGNAGGVEQLAIGPDTADPGDRTFAERDRKARVIEIFGGLHLGATTAHRKSLAATLRGGSALLAEVGRPDDVAADAHAAIEPGNDGAFGR